MSPLALAAANVRSLWRRLVGLTMLLAVTVAVCVTAFAVSHSADRAAHDRVQEGTANRSITVDRLLERTDSKLLGNAALHEIAAIPHVTSVQPRVQASFGFKDKNIPGVLLYATTLRPSLPPPLTKSVRKHLFPLHTGEIVLPARSQGSDLSSLLGRTITVSTTQRTSTNGGSGTSDTVHVVGLFDPSWQIDGPGAAYAADATVIRWAAAMEGVPAKDYTSVIGYSKATVLAASAADVPDVLHAIQQDGYAATTLQQEMTALPGVLDLIRAAGTLLLVVLGLVALLGALVVAGALSRQRVREIGILKAVGFRSRSILTMLVAEMALVGITGALVGALLGMGGAAATVAALHGDPELAPYLPAALPLPSISALGELLLLTVAVTVIGAWMPARRAAQLAPSTAISEW
ncbi:ABC transporter permease [Streptomyces sp. MUSC 125]|uniref:ABC transporter permease n=1 Tax=Streptomyces sp. MUSC 125 TaxID=1428624 RepID=UPI00057F9F84|nr:ABC transporter permease [Streptomyces sp. MUSC 125]KIE22788.1 ABC transporter permease [Streptomyces sp. MUSC 125]